MFPYSNPYNYQNYLPYQQPTIRNGETVSVNSEQEARYYPVAPATTVTFHNEKEPFIYRKTVGNSMDAPIFEIYKRIDGEISGQQTQATPVKEYVEKDEFDSLKAEINALKKELKKKGKNDE